MRRLMGVGFGLLTQGFFVLTLPTVYRFLRNDFAAAPAGPLWIDAGAALLFAVPHSVLLAPATRAWITRRLPSSLYGCLFCVATCATLWLQIALWRGSATVVWAWPESLRPLVHAAFLATWGVLLYSLWLGGLGYQTGLLPWWCWVTGRSVPQRSFQARGAYRLLRHPVYLSFLGLVWLTPVITADRAVLMLVWTVYVMVGSQLKDQRMVRFIGRPYREYMSRVPGVPLVPFGPLARRPMTLVQIGSETGVDAPIKKAA